MRGWTEEGLPDPNTAAVANTHSEYKGSFQTEPAQGQGRLWGSGASPGQEEGFYVEADGTG